MLEAKDIIVNPENEWRLEAPQPKGWARGVTNKSEKKYFMVSCDTHLSPPVTLFHQRLDKKWHDMLPRIETRDDGQKYIIMPGARPERLITFDFQGEDLLRSKAGAGISHDMSDENPLGWDRIQEQEFDGVDAEVMFANGAALLTWASANNEFVQAQCQVWNDWAWEVSKDYAHRSHPGAHLMTADVDMAVAEVQRVAKMGYKILTMPCKPVFGPHNVADPNYNLPMYDPLWAAIQDADMAMCFHVSTGRDPRSARGNGGAIINYVAHSLSPTMEPIINLCASGVFERFPGLRAATIEADAGWVPWALQKMDEAYLKHHFWVRPKLRELPSQYYRNNCYASFGEDDAAIALVERFNLTDNFMWANDYPHHEGSWPHSEPAIYRTFGNELKEETRAKLLGLNAAKCFGFPIPDKFK